MIANQRLLLRGGRVVDPSLDLDQQADVRCHAGVVTAIGALEPELGERVLDLTGLIVAPGLIDVHVHLREPGHEWKETIGSGTAAAAAGGFTTVFCMPNTEPALDSVSQLEEFYRRAARDAEVRVGPIAAISEARRGTIAVDFEGLSRAGAVGFSDDGVSTEDSGIMLAALLASRRTGKPVMVHCEDPALTAARLRRHDISPDAVAEVSAAAEEIIVLRDLALAEVARGWLHVCHVSTAAGVDAIVAARRRGVRVTAEAMPHHLAMTEAWVGGPRTTVNGTEIVMPPGALDDPDTKVHPPLRTDADARRLLAGLRRGELDIMATDHAPHAFAEKQGRPFAAAAPGFTGSELALPVMMSLVNANQLTLSDVVFRFSTMPARLWGLKGGTLRPGSPADIVVFDPSETWTVQPDALKSRSANTPLRGAMVRGKVKLTIIGGDERYRD